MLALMPVHDYVLIHCNFSGKGGLHQADISVSSEAGEDFFWHQDYSSSSSSSTAPHLGGSEGGGSTTGGSSTGGNAMSMLGRQGSSLIGLIGQVMENVRCVKKRLDM